MAYNTFFYAFNTLSCANDYSGHKKPLRRHSSAKVVRFGRRRQICTAVAKYSEVTRAWRAQRTGMLSMSKLHRKLIGVSFLSAIALAPFAANAADLYRNPPPSAYIPPAAFIDQNIWAGFYAGLNGGYGWGDNNGAISASDGFTSQQGAASGRFWRRANRLQFPERRPRLRP